MGTEKSNSTKKASAPTSKKGGPSQKKSGKKPKKEKPQQKHSNTVKRVAQRPGTPSVQFVKNTTEPMSQYGQINVSGSVNWFAIRDFCYALAHRGHSFQSDSEIMNLFLFFMKYLNDELGSDLTDATMVPRVLVQLKSLMTPRCVGGVAYDWRGTANLAGSFFALNMNLNQPTAGGYDSWTNLTPTWAATTGMREVQHSLNEGKNQYDPVPNAELVRLSKKNKTDPAFFVWFDATNSADNGVPRYNSWDSSGAVVSVPTSQVVCSESRIHPENLWVASLRGFIRSSTLANAASGIAQLDFQYKVDCPPALLPAAIGRFGVMKAPHTIPTIVQLDHIALKFATILQAALSSGYTNSLTLSDWMTVVLARVALQFAQWQIGVVNLRFNGLLVLPFGIANPPDKTYANIAYPVGLEDALRNLFPVKRKLPDGTVRCEIPLVYYHATDFNANFSRVFVTSAGGYSGDALQTPAWSFASWVSSRTGPSGTNNGISTSTGPLTVNCQVTDPYSTSGTLTQSIVSCDLSAFPVIVRALANLASYTVVAKAASLPPCESDSDIMIRTSSVNFGTNYGGSPTLTDLLRCWDRPMNVDEYYSKYVYPLCGSEVGALMYGRRLVTALPFVVPINMMQEYMECAMSQMLKPGQNPASNASIPLPRMPLSLASITAPETQKPLSQSLQPPSILLKRDGETSIAKIDVPMLDANTAAEFEKVANEIYQLGGRAKDAVAYFKSLRDPGKGFDPNDKWTGLARLVVNHIVPKYGRYGGPNYSEGKMDGRLFPGMKFVEPPEDLEDAFYRLHDTEYERGGRESKRRADEELVGNLLYLDKQGKLSVYGHLAIAYFGFISKVLPVHV